ncbi:hypothetical protein ACTHTV_10250, partial [Neisseria sp. P0015.S010]
MVAVIEALLIFGIGVTLMRPSENEKEWFVCFKDDFVILVWNIKRPSELCFQTALILDGTNRLGLFVPTFDRFFDDLFRFFYIA